MTRSAKRSQEFAAYLRRLLVLALSLSCHCQSIVIVRALSEHCQSSVRALS